jgi:hypothetical protein
MFSRLGFMTLLVCGLISCLSLAEPADGTAGKKIQVLAAQIAKILKEHKQSSVVIGAITGPPAPATGAGPGIQAALIDELRKLKVDVSTKSLCIIKGEYYPVEIEGKTEQLILQIELTVRDSKTGKRYGSISETLDAQANIDLIKILGLTTRLAAKATAESRNQILKQRHLDPKAPSVKGDIAKVDDSEQLGIEVLSRGVGSSEFIRVKPTIEEKQLFVTLDKDSEYQLNLHNDSSYEIAASVTIDGLDSFHFFQPQNRKPAGYIIPTGKMITVPGWAFSFSAEKKEESFRRFVVTEFAKSAAGVDLAKNADTAAYSTLKSSPRVGTITICFHPCWEHGKIHPDFKDTRSVEDKATGIGELDKAKAIQLERTIGPLLQAITIRYKK